MKVFVTGATGFIGSAIVRDLIGSGHEVIGLARSDKGAESLIAVGAKVQRGSLQDLDSLRSGADAADGVIHTAFMHDFSDYAEAAETDRRAIRTLGEVLVGSERPFVVTAGVAGVLAPGRLATEEDAPNPNSPRGSEQTALPFASRGVRLSVVRLPPSVHGEGDMGFVPTLISTAREKGVSAFMGEGLNRWSSVHRLDAARLFRLAVESAPAGARLHGVADEGVAVRDLAEIIGRHLNVPVVSLPVEQAGEHFGRWGRFFLANCPASSALTREWLGWEPVQPSLLEDLEEGHYFAET